MKHAIAGGITALALGAMACAPSKEDMKRASDSVAAAEAAARGKAAVQAGEIMATRRESQAFLDSARAAFAAKRFDATAAALKDAAAFARQQTDSASDAAKVALAASATELDRLAASVATGGVKSATVLSRAFARVHIAETQMLYAHAVTAWRATKPAAAGAELVMAADHFERVFKDAGTAMPDSSTRTLKEVRELATKLIQGQTVSPAGADATMTAFDHAISRAATTFAKK